jgi:hypothetical protein
MGRRKEFKQAAARPRESKGGLRFYARATARWVEAQPVPQPTVETPSGVYAEPGRGASGESSN